MQFSTLLPDFIASKQAEINSRGLMGFPVDSVEDTEHQATLAAELASLPGVTVYESPTTGLRLPVDRSFPPKMLYYFLIGDYGDHDMQLIARYVKPGSRVLELGGGVGLTGSLLAKISGNPVTVCEPNAVLHPSIERTFKSNNVDLNLIEAAVVSDNEPADQVTFHVNKDYWWSSLVETDNSEPIQVPAIRLSDLLSATEADTLLVDIEGYEVALLADTVALAPIHTLLVELHTPSIGTQASSRIITALVIAGFKLIDMGGHTFVFKRDDNKAQNPGPNGRWY